MVLIPIVMNKLDARGLFKRFPRANAPIQVGLVGIILTFSTPLYCAIFEQKAAIKLSRLEEEIQTKIKEMDTTPEILYSNKGL